MNFYITEGTIPSIAPPEGATSESESLLDNVQFALDMAGFVPLLGEAADVVNASVHLARGNGGQVGIPGPPPRHLCA